MGHNEGGMSGAIRFILLTCFGWSQSVCSTWFWRNFYKRLLGRNVHEYHLNCENGTTKKNVERLLALTLVIIQNEEKYEETGITFSSLRIHDEIFRRPLFWRQSASIHISISVFQLVSVSFSIISTFRWNRQTEYNASLIF